MLTGRRRPFTVIYWTVAAFVLVGGWAASRFLIPGVIESAYAGRSLEIFNDIITGQDEHPLTEYLAAWSSLANKLLAGASFAAVAGYALVIWHDRLRNLARRLLMESDPSRTVPSAFVFLGVLVGLTAGAVEAISIFLGLAYQPMYYSSEVLWMAPVAGAMAFGSLGIVFGLITLRWPLIPRFEAAVLALSAVAAYGVLRPVFSSVHPLAAAVLALGIGVQAARLSGRRNGRPGGRLRRWSGGVAGLVVMAALVHHASGWVGERRSLAALPPSQEGAPNILLLILDTVRAEDMSLYGYGRPTTPVLDALATRSVVFDRAMAPTSWTLPSHGTVFTGRWPTELNVDFEVPLDDSWPTLAEFFTKQGYVSAGFVANYYYATEYFGLDRGFVHYEDQPVSWPMLVHNTWLTRTLANTIRTGLGQYQEAIRKPATQVNHDFLAWRSTAPERPYFAFLNYIDAHAPYRPPQPFRSAFGDGEGRYWLTGESDYPEGTAEDMQAAYDGGIAYIDHEIGKLLAELERRGELDNTVVIVTSDHGEEFGEHGLFGHDQYLYLASIHVPLLLRLPSDASGGTRVSHPVTLRDLPGTIVDLAGLGESRLFPGTSLRDMWDQPHATSPAGASPVFAHVDPLRPDGPNPLRSVVLGDKHYIAWEDGREELYDIAADPGEQHDLSDSLATELQELRKILATFP